MRGRQRSALLRRRWTRATIAVAAVVGLVVTASPVGAGHVGFHRYSIARETSRPGYLGIEVTRWDNTMRGIPNDGCSQPISGQPMYQTEYVAVDNNNWMELGTGHQCNDTFRYWYWGYRFNGNWFLMGHRPIPGTQKHAFRISREGTGTWHYEIDATRMGTLGWGVTGGSLAAGLESYAQGGTTENQGQPGTQNYENLRYRSTTGGATWFAWFGQDAQQVDNPLCGSWLNATTWRTGANVGGC